MPIRVPDELPAVSFLRNENVFVMTSSRAKTQEIRPLKVLVLNLMPVKILLLNIFKITIKVVQVLSWRIF